MHARPTFVNEKLFNRRGTIDVDHAKVTDTICARALEERTSIIAGSSIIQIRDSPYRSTRILPPTLLDVILASCSVT